jgi:hypothetical protein
VSSIDPEITGIVTSVDTGRISTGIGTTSDFTTHNTCSNNTASGNTIGASRDWICPISSDRRTRDFEKSFNYTGCGAAMTTTVTTTTSSR